MVNVDSGGANEFLIREKSELYVSGWVVRDYMKANCMFELKMYVVWKKYVFGAKVRFQVSLRDLIRGFMNVIGIFLTMDLLRWHDYGK